MADCDTPLVECFPAPTYTLDADGVRDIGTVGGKLKYRIVRKTVMDKKEGE